MADAAIPPKERLIYMGKEQKVHFALHPSEEKKWDKQTNIQIASQMLIRMCDCGMMDPEHGFLLVYTMFDDGVVYPILIQSDKCMHLMIMTKANVKDVLVEKMTKVIPLAELVCFGVDIDENNQTAEVTMVRPDEPLPMHPVPLEIASSYDVKDLIETVAFIKK